MRRFEERITINAPVEKVFAYVSDFPRHAEWAEHGLQVTKTSEGPVGVGTTYSTEAKQFGTQREQSTITDVKPNELFGWDSKGALGVAHHWFAIRAEGGSTVLTKGGEFRQPSFLAKMTGFRIKKLFPAGLRQNLEKIKSEIEGSAAAG
ncbi:MAG: SRPBCC family protein [Thermoleophilaceae bacterium]